MIREKTHPSASISVFLIKAPRMAIVPFFMPTAYGDGLWGLQNTDITDAHGSIITDLLILSFLMALWILDGSSAYQASPVMWHTSIHITLRMRKIRGDPLRRRRINPKQ